MFGRNFFSQSVGSTAVQVFDPPTRTGDFKKKINKWEEGKQKKKKGVVQMLAQLKKKKKKKTIMSLLSLAQSQWHSFVSVHTINRKRRSRG